jgi:anthraniloyl-CoA monooxygenase
VEGLSVDIVCIGAGPAGLHLAVNLKLRNPDHRIRVFEKNPEGRVHGWGFGYWDAVLDTFYEHDPVVAAEMEAASGVWDGIEVLVDDRPPAYLGGYGLSMSRARLLEILVARARELGVELSFQREVTDAAEFADADLVVAADGIGSPTREAHRAEFGTGADQGNNYYLWLGTDKLFSAFRYVFRHTPAGWMWMHCHHLDAERSTCILECPPDTWHGLGLHEKAADEALAEIGKIFAAQLDGHRLVSQVDTGGTLGPGGTGGTLSPERARQVRNRRWYHDNLVLVGDAAHTTHFSVGSGTRLALGDAQALADAVHAHGTDVAAGLRAYDSTRRPEIEHVQHEALRSMCFLESIPARLDRGTSPVQLAHDISRRLGTRGETWRYVMHLATQVGPLRIARRQVTAGRRNRRVRRRTTES